MEPVFNLLFGTYPREFGKNRTFVRTKNEALDLINTSNRKSNCWMTIHRLGKKRDYTTTTIEKLFFDLDGKDCFDKTKQFHKFLDNKDLQHLILYSGNGYHVYTMTMPASKQTGIKSLKNTVRNAQLSIIKEAGMTFGNPKEKDFDSHVIGDIGRISRVPNTLNLKGKRYCIPLTEDDLETSHEEIKEKAKNQYFQYNLFGNKLLNLSQYDKDIPGLVDTTDNINISDTELVRILNDKTEIKYKKIVDKLPSLIQRLLATGQDGYRDRYITILAFREIGTPIEITILICRKFWSEKKFNHAIINEKNQFQYLYNRLDLFFPNWETLKKEGYGITKEDDKYSFYR